MLATFVLASSLANIAAVDVPKAGFETPALVQVAEGRFGQGNISSGGEQRRKSRRRLFGAELENLPVNRTNKAGGAKGSNPQRVKQFPTVHEQQSFRPGKKTGNAGNNDSNRFVPGKGSLGSSGFHVPRKGNDAINQNPPPVINLDAVKE